MTERASAVLKMLRDLSPEEQAAVVGDLEREMTDDQWDRFWLAECDRRMEEHRLNPSRVVTHEELMATAAATVARVTRARDASEGRTA